MNKQTTGNAASSCPSEYQMDRLLFGPGMPEAELTLFANHVIGCAECRARKEAALRPAPPEILSRLVASLDAAPVPVRPKRRLVSYWPQATLLAAASIALFVALPKTEPVHTAIVSPSERIKSGGVHLNVIRRNIHGRVERVLDGDTVLAGESLRFEVSTPGTAFVSVVSIDGRGEVSVFAPASGTAVSVKGGETTLLEGAVLLDDVVGTEQLVLVACPRAFEVSEAMKAAEQAAPKAAGPVMRLRALPSLNQPCEFDELMLKKEVSP